MCGFRSITSLSHSILSHPSKELVAPIVISSHVEEKKLMYRLKTLSLCVNS